MLEKGYFYEKIAQKYVINKGMKIISTNFHSEFGEVDIIASKDEYLIFIEVRMRKYDSVVLPAESVEKKKQARIIKTALDFMSNYHENLQPRFDVLEVINKKGKVYINHISNAFWLDDGLKKEIWQ